MQLTKLLIPFLWFMGLMLLSGVVAGFIQPYVPQYSGYAGVISAAILAVPTFLLLRYFRRKWAQ